LVVGVVVLVVTAVVAFSRFRRKKSVALQSTTDESLDDMIKQLREAAGKLGLNVSRSEGKPKYGAQKIVLGIPRMAFSGIAMFVNYPGGLEALQKKAGEGLEAVKQEILASGSQYAIELMKYILTYLMRKLAAARRNTSMVGCAIAKTEWSSLTLHLPWREALS
jgi:hypothetical protein